MASFLEMVSVPNVTLPRISTASSKQSISRTCSYSESAAISTMKSSRRLRKPRRRKASTRKVVWDGEIVLSSGINVQKSPTWLSHVAFGVSNAECVYA